MDTRISVAIAAYEMNNKGEFFIERCIKSILQQNYSNIEIVVSDHSVDDKVEKICKELGVVYIKYAKNRGSSSANFNNAIVHCTGDFIKILCQDDILYDENSLSLTIEAIQKNNKKWLVSSYYHTHDLVTPVALHYPTVNNFEPTINLIGTHSCLTISKDVDILFDENLIWFMDCEYYSRLYRKYLSPEYLSTPTMVQSIWSGQVSSTMITSKVVNYETNYIKQKTTCL